jgi:hypothetical protein
MRKLLLFLIPVVLAFIVFGIFLFIVNKTTVVRGALQVTSIPIKSVVYLDDKKIGETPLCKCDQQETLPVGQYSLRVVPSDNSLQSYEDKININPSVLTVIDRTFGDIGKSSGSILTLTPISQKTAQVFITSLPNGTDVLLDSNSVGKTPLTLTITDSDHEIVLSKDGYKEKSVHIHGIVGYKLTAIVTLATENITAIQENASSSSGELNLATSSAGLKGQQVVILDTPTGFLRVRDVPSLTGNEIAQVIPGEKFSYLGEQEGWLQVKLNDGKIGWVSTQYAQKQ